LKEQNTNKSVKQTY